MLPQWLVDAALFWRRPPEHDYLWQRALAAIKPSASLPTISSDEDEEEQAADAVDEDGQQFDWKGASDEILAFLDDTDSSDEPADDATGGDGSSKKRSRKNSTASSSADGAEPGGESPLSKRQRLARARSSKLRQDATADDVAEPDQRRPSSSSESLGVSHVAEDEGSDIDLDALDQELFA